MPRDVGDAARNFRSPVDDTSDVGRCLHMIRQMILSGDLAPGEKIHQAGLAERLQVSRVPVREALSRLHADGLLVHRQNHGYTVARFNGAELREIYLMRRLLETELLRTAELDAISVDDLETINAEMVALANGTNAGEYQRLNVEFHFTIFAASPLAVVRQEVARLWNMSAFYRSLYLFVTEDTSHLGDEHEQIIDAVRKRDLDELVRVMDHHRAKTEQVVVRLPGR